MSGSASLLARPLAFERGEKLFLTTPITLVTPTDAQIEEFAFASGVKSQAPNEHIGWLSGKYVEAGRANLNGAMWLSDELALKSLTPMLMPITVMHDPRTAVGTIADCKLIAPGDAAAASTSRIDTILAVWKHRFPEVWAEAEKNITDGTMMQSMECLSPSYCCSECGQQYLKLREGKERASWCEHLRAETGRRILQDVCFTGTGLIFGTRGGKGAYTEAYLSNFQDEIAEYHAKAHIDSSYRSSERSTPQMARVEIDESEIAALRDERNTARTGLEEKAEENRTLTTKLEKAEAEVAKEKTRADDAEAANTKLKDEVSRTTVRTSRLEKLGPGFLAKLGEFTRGRLNEAAATQSDEEWDATLKEKEELSGVKRDTEAEAGAGGGAGSGTEAGGAGGSGSGSGSGSGAADESGSVFKDEELANFARRGVGSTASSPSGSSASRQLARSFAERSKPKPATAAK